MPLKSKKRVPLYRVDPTRTYTLRRAFCAKLKQKFKRLKLDIQRIIADQDILGLRKQPQPAFNMFCPTGLGGGVDPTCSKDDSGRGGGGSTSSPKATYDSASQPVKSLIDDALANTSKNLTPDKLKKLSDKDRREAAQELTSFAKYLRDYPSDKFPPKVVKEYEDTLTKLIPQIRKIDGDTTANISLHGDDKDGKSSIKDGTPVRVTRPGWVLSEGTDTPKVLVKAIVEPIITHNTIRKVGSKWRLYSRKGKNLGTFDSREAALKHEQEVEYFKQVDNKKDHEYASTQFDVNDPRILAGLERIQSTINPVDLIKAEKKPHVTIRYGLHDEPDLAIKVRQLLGAIGPVIFKIGRLSLFSSPENDVLKFNIDSARLEELNRRLALLPGTNDYPKYSPHLTVAYLKPGTGYKYLQPSRITGLEFMMNRVTFSNRKRNKQYFIINTLWKFHTSPQKIEQFQKWLASQFDSRIRSKTDEQLWEEYIQQGFRKGVGRAFDDVQAKDKARAAGTRSPDFFSGAREQFLRSSFIRPVAVEKVRLLAKRAFDELKGVTDEMSTKMSRALTDGLVQGLSPREVARELGKVVDLGEARAETVARTELIRAHSEGQLEALEQLGVEEVGVMVEWTVTPDNKLCPKCEALEGVVLTLDEAKGMLPLHPMCRCTWIPANVGEDRDQKRSKSDIEDAFAEADIDETVSSRRPKSVLNTFSNILHKH